MDDPFWTMMGFPPQRSPGKPKWPLWVSLAIAVFRGAGSVWAVVCLLVALSMLLTIGGFLIGGIGRVLLLPSGLLALIALHLHLARRWVDRHDAW